MHNMLTWGWMGAGVWAAVLAALHLRASRPFAEGATFFVGWLLWLGWVVLMGLASLSVWGIDHWFPGTLPS